MNRKINVIIVDDESIAREGIALLLSKENDFRIIDTCKNGIEAIQSIQENLPDVIFLDIQMPGINGFDVLKNIPSSIRPIVVFITAYDEFALKAFDFHAVDYLLKPFTDERFWEMLRHIREIFNSKNILNEHKKIEELTERLNKQHKGNIEIWTDSDKEQGGEIQNRLIIKDSGKIRLIPLPHILYIEAYDYYVKIHLPKEIILARIPLKVLSEKLPEKKFVRIHRSSIVNTDHILEYTHTRGGENMILLRSGVKLKVSESYRKQLTEILK